MQGLAPRLAYARREIPEEANSVLQTTHPHRSTAGELPPWERSDSLEKLGADVAGAQALRMLLDELEFDRHNLELRDPSKGGDYAVSPFAMVDSPINHETVLNVLRRRAVQDISQKRLYNAFRFFVYGQSLSLPELKKLFGSQAPIIPSLLASGFIRDDRFGLFQTNGLSLASMRLPNHDVLYVFVDTPPHIQISPDAFSARVYLGVDSMLLLNHLQHDRAFSGVGVDLGAGSGVLAFGVLKTYEQVTQMILLEIDERARQLEHFNAALNGLSNRIIVVRDRAELGRILDQSHVNLSFAVSNPPFHAIPDEIEIPNFWNQLLRQGLTTRDGKTYLNLRELSIKAGWGGTDGLRVVQEFLDIFEALCVPDATAALYSMQWPGREAGPTYLQHVLEKRGWTTQFDKQPSEIPGTPLLMNFLTVETAERAAETVMRMLVAGNPHLWSHLQNLLKESRAIQSQYENLGITHFHAGFVSIKRVSPLESAA